MLIVATSSTIAKCNTSPHVFMRCELYFMQAMKAGELVSALVTERREWYSSITGVLYEA